MASIDCQPPRPLASCTDDRAVGRAPPRARARKLDAQRPDLRRLLQKTLAALERELPALRAAKFTGAEVAELLVEQLGALEAPGAATDVPATAPIALLSALRRLERESPPGALLSVRELRARCELDKPSFDRAALELAEQGKVSLHAHDHAGALAESERRALIEDARGVHYIGIASIPDARHEVSP